MKKLVEDIDIGETLEKEGKPFLITGTYEVNGEGRGFITTDKSGIEQRFSATCGTHLYIQA